MNSLSRRQFLGSLAVVATSSGFILKKILENQINFPQISISGQDSKLFHQLRDGYFESAGSVVDQNVYDCIVLGGGISGLSAVYHLEKFKKNKYLLLEGQNLVGGNSQYGSNQITKYPYGAHYLPVPNSDLKELNDFLYKIGVITKLDSNGNHSYNEEYLIHGPETKLLYQGKWHDGLIPFSDLGKAELVQVDLFLKTMDKFSSVYGNDFKKAFTLPVSNSSQDEQFLSLDKVNFKDFLVSQGINSEFIFWYVNYATKDDYGTSYLETSAWAGIHYFASRPKNSNQADIFTWPEGNGFLVEAFRKLILSEIKVNSLIVNVKQVKSYYEVTYFDETRGELVICRANSVISCLPHFINQRIFSNSIKLPDILTEYVPWLVANLSINELPEEYRNIPWDSVSYHSESLGFVRADHQNLNLKNSSTVLTYYFPFSEIDSSAARWKLSLIELSEIGKNVIEDLDRFYPALRNKVDKIDLWLWGHAMAKPVVGRMREAILNSNYKISDNLYFAHTDYSGISIFEEAFYQGVGAASAVSS
jgi:hypothetical protein